VAIQAFFHRWNPRMGGTLDVRMAELTLDLFYPVVNPGTEGYRLRRSEIGGRE